MDYEEEFALEHELLPDCTAIKLNFDLSEKKGKVAIASHYISLKLI